MKCKGYDGLPVNSGRTLHVAERTRDRQETEECVPRLAMVIDHLEPGGAQRQFSLLATSLHRVGYDVKVIVFRPDFFFGETLQDVDIPVVYLKSRSRFQLRGMIRQEIQRSRADVVISFLPWSNLMVELAGLPTRTFALIVSERDTDVTFGIKRRIAYHCHRLADVVVSNSHAQGEIVERVLRRWKVRTQVIVNGVDVRHFEPAVGERVRKHDRVRLLVVARFSPQKNVIRFIDAVSLVCTRHPQIGLEVDWYGKAPSDGPEEDAEWALNHRDKLAAYYQKVVANIARHGLRERFRVNAPVSDVRELYQHSDVVCLPSLHEGCSNVIAEAMACGVPVLASRVGDNMRLVQEGRNGLLFDPMSVDDMANAIVRFAGLAASERARLGREGRVMVEEQLSVEVLTERYTKLIQEVRPRRRSS